MRAKRLTRPEIALIQGVSIETVKEDRARLLELRKSEAVGAVDAHIEQLQALADQIQAKLDGGPVEVVRTGPTGKEYTVEVEDRAQLLRELRQIEMDIAKLDGSLVERREDKHEISNLADLVKSVASDRTET